MNFVAYEIIDNYAPHKTCSDNQSELLRTKPRPLMCDVQSSIPSPT